MTFNGSITDGNLWYAPTDDSSFARETDPPTSGGTDATVHHDLTGRLFWAEQSPSFTLQVGVRVNGNWLPPNPSAEPNYTVFEPADRPWFVTNSSGVTFLAFSRATSITERRVEVWTNQTGIQGWTVLTSNVSWPTSLTDFTNATDGTLYLLMLNQKNDNLFVGIRSPTDTTWSFTPEFPWEFQPSFGLPRVVVDLSKNLYVIYGKQEDQAYSIWGRYFNTSTSPPSWSSPSQLGGSGKTSAMAGPVAGSTGRVGVAWYEADGNFIPNEAPADTTWRAMYAVFRDMNGSPTLVERVNIRDSVHKGPMANLGDFVYAIRRQGNPVGRVAVAFACDGNDPQLGCVASGSGHPIPFFALQTDGPGVLT